MFKGFSKKTIEFLLALRENNNKPWFDEHRNDYVNYLRMPFLELVKALTPDMLSIDHFFDITPGKSISRINRDIRFSKDKSPYRPNMWLSFKRQYADWKMEPTFYFELAHDSYRFGMGFYNMPKETLEKLREMIDTKNPRFMEIFRIYQEQDLFEIAGDSYKRCLNPSLPEDLLEWYQKKELYFVCNKKLEDLIFTPQLAPFLADAFHQLEPFYHFFVALRNE